ncbi:MAG: hypothetical protein KAJ23_15025, partial [Maribacter sp.]|nr:hypothetical protein [Maribacter sp.]
NVFLAQRDNYTLISDDLIYSSGLHLDSGLISSELYLEKRLPKERRDEIFQFLLQKRYIGLTISPENLYRSYINQNKAGLPHVYEYALLNLSLRENWISSNINVIVAFLRKVALNPAISKEKYGFDATNLFATTIPNFTSPSLALILKREIEKEFKYLGDYLEITLAALLDALRYTRS